MKITFLGTSHGYSEKKRFKSATLIEISDSYYLIDAGAPVEWIMVNTDRPFNKMKGIFITHMHNDHVNGLSCVFEGILRAKHNGATCFFPSEEAKDGFLQWLSVLQDSTEKVTDMIKLEISDNKNIFESDGLLVSAKQTEHFKNNSRSFSYTFEHNGKKVLFTGDMALNFPEYSSLTGQEHYDLVVCEMAHANLCDVCEMLKQTNTDRMIITHYNILRLENHEKIFSDFPFPVTIVTDGYEIVL